MNINFNKNQLDKIKRAHNENKDVTIQLKHNQIGNGKKEYNFDANHITKLKNAKKNKIGCRIELTPQQIKKGGFLPLLIAGVGAASAAVGAASAVYSSYRDAKHKKLMEEETIRHNKELEKIISKISQGSGLKKKKLKK